MNLPPFTYLFLTFIKVHFLLLWGRKNDSYCLPQPRKKIRGKNKKKKEPSSDDETITNCTIK